MEVILHLLIISYAVACLILLISWLKISPRIFDKSTISSTKISVIIPVRNEEENILKLLQSIENQTLDKNKFELIIVNDSSTDNTKNIIEDYQKDTNLRITLLDLLEERANSSPKKRAITKALKIATGELIVTTDGDCTFEKKWLFTIANFYEKTDAFFISAPVSFTAINEGSLIKKFWNAFQIIEFGSLIGSGACAIQLSSPNMCSGANIAYKKSVFFEVNGYDGNEQIASGDDEFLMQKIAAKYPDKVHYLKSKDAIVQTHAHADINSFYQQRKRWASKWKFYDNWQPTALAVYVALVNAVTVWAICVGRLDLILIKFSFEFVFLSVIVLFLGKGKTIPFIPLTQLVYPFYVLVIAVAVQGLNNYNWKGRKLK